MATVKQILQEIRDALKRPDSTSEITNLKNQLTEAQTREESLTSLLNAANVGSESLKNQFGNLQVERDSLSRTLETSADLNVSTLKRLADVARPSDGYDDLEWVWSGTLQTGDWKKGFFTTIQHDNGLSVVVADGIPTLIHTVSNLQKPVNSAKHHRAEVTLSVGPGDLQEGDIGIDRCEFFVEKMPVMPVDGQWRVFPRQRHEWAETAFGPEDAAALHKNIWSLRGMAGTFDAAKQYTAGTFGPQVDIAQLMGKWNTLEVATHFSPGWRTGWHDVTLNGTKFDRVYMATMIVDPLTGRPSPLYFKFGLYQEESVPLSVLRTRKLSATRRRPK